MRPPLRPRLRAAPAPLLAVLAAAPAAAQILPPDESIHFSRYTSVVERQIPGYETPGLAVGSFTLSPALEVRANYTDNLFALEHDGESAAYAQILPSAQLQSNWTTRSLSLSLNGQLDRYAGHASENTNSVNASAYATQDLGGEIRVRAIAHFRATRESRESENAFSFTVRPVKYRDYDAALGLSKRTGHFQFAAEGGVQRFDYDDAQLVSGGILDQQYRDSTTTSARGRVDYVATPAIAYFVQLTHFASTFPERDTLGVRRGADTLEALAGTRFELPVLARGEIGLGYLSSSYRDSELRRFAGLAVHANVTLFPTQLTNVTFNASRSVNDAGTPQSSTYVSLVGGVRVDHELLRALRLGAGVQFERDSFNGEDRRDRRVDAIADATYRLNRTFSLRVSFDRLDLSSTGAARYKSFSRDRVMIGLGVRA